MAAPVEASVFLSGASSDGGAQTDPDASLGNFRSSTKISSVNNITAPSNVTGVVVDKVSLTHDFKPVTGTLTNGGNTVSRASLRTPTGAATWQPKGGSHDLIINPGVVEGGTIVDASAGARTVTANAQAHATNFESPIDGKSVRIDSTEYVDFPSSAQFDLGPVGGGNDWTIDWWMSMDSLGVREFFGTFAGGSDGWRIGLETTIRLFANGTERTLSWPNKAINTWFHLAFVKSGTTITVYENGTSLGTMGDVNMDDVSLPFGLGRGSATANFAGYFKNFRITKGTALWTSGFTPPLIITDTNVALLIRPSAAIGSTSIVDDSDNNHTPTNTGTPTVDRKDPANSSMTFDGTTDSLTVPDHADFDFGAGDFTLEAYVRTSVSTGDHHIMSKWLTTGNAREVALLMNASGFAVLKASSDGTAISINIAGTIVIDDGNWHHIVGQRIGNDWNVTVDGVEDVTTNQNITINTGTIAFRIGDSETGSEEFNGQIAHLSTTKGRGKYPANFIAVPKVIVDEQIIEFAANGESVRSSALPISSTDELAPSNIGTSMLELDTGVGASAGSTQSITVGNADGTLTYTNTGTLLQYTAPGDTIGPTVDVGSNGTYTLRSNDASLFLEVTVTAASLPGSDQSDTLTITRGDNVSNLFDAVTASEATSGGINYRAVIIKNEDVVSLDNFGVFIDRQTPFNTDDMEIAVEALVVNKIQTIANEITAPVGIVFSKPSFASPLNVATDLSSAFVALYLDMDGADASTTFTDQSPAVHGVTANGNAQVDTDTTDAFGNNDGVLLLDGAGDYLSILDNADFVLGPDFTIDFFVKTSSAATEILISQWKFTGGNDIAWRLFTLAGKVLFEGSTNGTVSAFTVTSTSTIDDGSWHHIRAIKRGSVEQLFIDGVREGTDGAVSGTLANVAQPVLIGTQDSGTEANFFTGSIDDLFILNGFGMNGNFTPRTSAIGIANIPGPKFVEGERVGVWIKRQIQAGGEIFHNNNFQLGLKYDIQ